MDIDKLDGVSVSIKEKFLEIQRMFDEQDAMDNPNEPYKKKYESIKILKEIIEELHNIISMGGSENEIVILAITHFYVGILHSDTEEVIAAEKHFTKCIDLLKGRELEPKAILTVINALNQLGIVWTQWGQPAKAKVFLERAEQLYMNFIANVESDPISMGVTMGVEDIKVNLCAGNILKRLHTLTLYYLTQIYGTLKDKHRFAAYCHRTLSMQLSQTEETQDLDYVNWALNAATLAQYFIENNAFSQARHHLAAASYTLQKYENILKTRSDKETNDSIAAELENYNYRYADLARCWAKYGIILLNVSKQRLLKMTEEKDECLSESKSPSMGELADFMEDLTFVDLKQDLGVITSKDLEAITSQVTDKYLLDFNDAKLVFLNVQKWLDKAKTYYTLNSHASDYAHIAQDMSEAYKHLSFYEEDDHRRAKMHKRRINILEAVIKELNPQYYRTICRQIWIELGETYVDIFDIKLDRLRTITEPTTQKITKLNYLIKNSIKHFRSYLDSVETIKSSTGLESIPDDQLYSTLYSYSCLGRLYNRIINSELPQKIENMQNSLDAYKFVVNYQDEHPDKIEELKKYEFISLSKEFVSLLPIQLDKLKRQLVKRN